MALTLKTHLSNVIHVAEFAQQGIFIWLVAETQELGRELEKPGDPLSGELGKIFYGCFKLGDDTV